MNVTTNIHLDRDVVGTNRTVLIDFWKCAVGGTGSGGFGQNGHVGGCGGANAAGTKHDYRDRRGCDGEQAGNQEAVAVSSGEGVE